MKKLLQTLYLTAAMIGVTPAHADSITYLCRDHHKTYPVTLDYGTSNDEGDCGDASCIITWRGTTYKNINFVEGCRLRYAGTDHGVTVDLCTATKGYADLKVGDKSYDCELKP